MNSQTKADLRPLAVVTGASNGIGYELAKQFAEHGFDLVVTGQHAGIIEAANVFHRLGATVESLQIDLSYAAGVEEFWALVCSCDRSIEAVAINAGVGVGGAFADSTKLEDELKMIDLNVKSSVHLAKLVVPRMVAQGRGRILMTSSIAATMPTPYEAVYGATKAFLQSFAMSLRSELAKTGVTVTALLPGATETNFFHRAGMDDTRVGAAAKDDAEEVAREAFKALMAGDEQIVAGSFKNKIFASKVVPESIKTQMHKRMSEPGSAHH